MNSAIQGIKSRFARPILHLQTTTVQDEVPTPIEDPGIVIQQESTLNTADNALNQRLQPLRTSKLERQITAFPNVDLRIREILCSHNRSDDDAAYLCKKLNHFRFFTDFQEENPGLAYPDAMIGLCKIVRLVKFTQDTILVNAGESFDPSKIYVIFSGQVGLYKFQPKSESEDSSAKEDSQSSILQESPVKRTPRSSRNSMLIRRDSSRDLKTLTHSGSFRFPKAGQNNLSLLKEIQIKRRGSVRDLNQALNLDIKKEEDKPQPQKIQMGVWDRGWVIGNIDAKKQDVKAEYTFITNEPCEMIMFSVKDLEYLQVRYAKENTKMISFLIENVPELEKVIKRQKLRKFDEIFHEERFKLHHTIVNEGDHGKKIYLLYDGNCHVFKNETLLCILNPGMFVGEELLQNPKDTYLYTVKAASSTVRLLVAERQTLITSFPSYLITSIEELFEKKFHQNEAMMRKKKASKQSFYLTETFISPKNTPKKLQSFCALPSAGTSPSSDTLILNKSPQSKSPDPKIIGRSDILESVYSSIRDGKSGSSAFKKHKFLKSVDLNDITSKKDSNKIGDFKLDFGDRERYQRKRISYSLQRIVGKENQSPKTNGSDIFKSRDAIPQLNLPKPKSLNDPLLSPIAISGLVSKWGSNIFQESLASLELQMKSTQAGSNEKTTISQESDSTIKALFKPQVICRNNNGQFEACLIRKNGSIAKIVSKKTEQLQKMQEKASQLHCPKSSLDVLSISRIR